MSCPEGPQVSSPTQPKIIQPQAACLRGEGDNTTRDEDFVLQVEAEEAEESEAPSENSSDPEPAAPRSTARGSTQVIWVDKNVEGEMGGLLGGSAGCPEGRL